MRLYLTISFLCLSLLASSSTTDTLSVYSRSMDKSIDICIILPDSYNNGKAFPVVYFLHGAGDSATEVMERIPKLGEYADLWNIIIVCADGGLTSWYFDSPIDPAMQYETFVSSELLEYIDKNYNTLAERSGRAITGNSMGGHGALYLSFRHKDLFGAAGSISGGVDFRPFPNDWDIAKRLGPIEEYPDNWDKNTVLSQLDLINNGDLDLIIDCGVDDFFFDVNIKLHQEMIKRGIGHDFSTRPGQHNWHYFRNSFQYHILFFHNYFEKQKQP